MSQFNPRVMLWESEDGRIFSGPREASVDAQDGDFLAAKGTGFLRAWPRDAAGQQTWQALQDIIGPYGMFASPQAYAASMRWQKVNGGVTYKGRPIATDDASRANIQAEAMAAKIMGEFPTVWKCSAGTWMPIKDAESMIEFAGALRNYVATCFEVEANLAKATSKAEVDAAIWPSATL